MLKSLVLVFLYFYLFIHFVDCYFCFFSSILPHFSLLICTFGYITKYIVSVFRFSLYKCFISSSFCFLFAFFLFLLPSLIFFLPHIAISHIFFNFLIFTYYVCKHTAPFVISSNFCNDFLSITLQYFSSFVLNLYIFCRSNMHNNSYNRDGVIPWKDIGPNLRRAVSLSSFKKDIYVFCAPVYLLLKCSNYNKY